MTGKLVLTGTASELKSIRGQKVIATALYSSVPLALAEAPSSESLQSTTTALAKSLVLTIDGQTHISTTNAMMRLIASLAPASQLQGSSDSESALVDGWVSFGWNSLEVPLEALEKDPNMEAIKADIATSLGTMDVHLKDKAYMVGDAITLADISLAFALHKAVLSGICEVKDVNVARWYETMKNQDFFKKTLSSPTTSGTLLGGASIVASHGVIGVTMNGQAPPVIGTMYRRRRIRIKEAVANDGSDYLGQTITVAGWARTTRNANKGQLLFVELSDGSTGASLQCVLDSETTEGFEECKASGGTGASFQLVGTLIASQGAGQAVELQVASGTLLGAVYGGQDGTVGGMFYPLSKKKHTLEYMREVAHLRPRGRIHSAAMRIRHAMAYATHNFFHNHGFVYVHTPILTGADCEGAGEQFGVTTMLGSDHLATGLTLPLHQPPPPEDEEKKLSKKEQKRLAKKKETAATKGDTEKPVEEKFVGAVDYSQDFFGHRVNLTVSGQLNVETHACALSDVYTFGPTFRAEKSFTSRHLSEFWMIEPEIAFADLTDDINLAEDYLKYCVKYALECCADDLEFFENCPEGEPGLRDRLRNVLENPFKRLTYTEAIDILQKAVAEGVVFEEKPVWGMDLPSEHERYLCEQVFKQPVVLTNYPKEIKAFYMKVNEDKKTVAAADILVPKIGEIIGGSQREHRFEVLKERCIEMHLDPKAVWWYLDLRRYGTVPHAGFGLGFERLILFITGLDNIRDVIPFPRWAGHADF